MKEFKPISEENQKFNSLIAEILVHEVLGIKEAFITSESFISDFRPYPEQQAVLKGGKYEFSSTYYDPQEIISKTGKHVWHLSEEELKEFEKTSLQLISKDEVSFDADILSKIKEIFGVNLPASILEEKIFKVALTIGKQITPETKDKIIKKYP